mmetsp:Transcript_8943/g.26858  ORF Transcript_8943/g.26858 Transcript_8943/m.26858 type:complete len:241 (-) Transcript_8943:2-724(-)
MVLTAYTALSTSDCRLARHVERCTAAASSCSVPAAIATITAAAATTTTTSKSSPWVSISESRAEVVASSHSLLTHLTTISAAHTRASAHATRCRGSRLHLLTSRIRHHVGRVVEVILQILNTLIGQEIIVVLPAEDLGHVLPRLQTLHQLEHVQVRHVHILVSRRIEILLRHHHTILKQLLVHLHTVLLRNQHLAFPSSVCPFTPLPPSLSPLFLKSSLPLARSPHDFQPAQPLFWRPPN